MIPTMSSILFQQLNFILVLSTSNISCKTFQIHSINRVFLNFYAPAANRKLNYVRINLFINRLFSGFLDCQFVFRSNTLRAITIFGQFLCSQICILGRSQPSSSRCCRWGIIDQESKKRNCVRLMRMRGTGRQSGRQIGGGTNGKVM